MRSCHSFHTHKSPHPPSGRVGDVVAMFQIESPGIGNHGVAEAVRTLHEQYTELKQKAQPFLDAIEIASEKVWAFINAILARGKELYEHKHPARNRGQDMEI